jgi:hypothetical protein
LGAGIVAEPLLGLNSHPSFVESVFDFLKCHRKGSESRKTEAPKFPRQLR